MSILFRSSLTLSRQKKNILTFHRLIASSSVCKQNKRFSEDKPELDNERSSSTPITSKVFKASIEFSKFYNFSNIFQFKKKETSLSRFDKYLVFKFSNTKYKSINDVPDSLRF